MADTFSKAATKPAMVPWIHVEAKTAYTVVALCAGLALFVNGVLLLLAIPILAGCYQITKNDDQAFRILWRFFKRRILNPDFNATFWKSSSYTSNKTRF